METDTSGRNGLHPVSEKTYHPDRALVLVDRYSSKSDSTGNRGTHGGNRVVLAADGTLARLRRSGSWSRWQGEGESTESTWETITASEAMKDCQLEVCLDAISEALDNYLKGEHKEWSRASLARAEKLNALASLVKS